MGEPVDLSYRERAQRPWLDALALHDAVQARRAEVGLRWFEVAGQAGVAPATFQRMAAGNAPSADGLVRVMVWLGQTDLTPYIGH